jgi:PhzF family phenazine biosynthesis protein
MTRRFKQVDVFTDRALAGNPVAVVLDAEGLDEATMRRLAAWTNLSETTFVLPPTVAGASYRLRIFTPRSELPFAGHPTIGSAHAILEAGIAAPRDGVLHQECAAGVFPIGVDGGRLMVRVPAATILHERAIDREAIARALGAPVVGAPVPIDLGPVWLVAELADEATLRTLSPDFAAIETIQRTLGLTAGITVFARSVGDGAALAVRSFAPAVGVPEDPVCGSGNAAVAAYLVAAGRLDRAGARYRASQGREVGRNGVVEVAVTGAHIEIGGRALTVVDGTVAL